MSKNIYITGFMGAGKTRTGKLLAQKTNRTFFDSDHVIEEKSGLSISDIFEKHGEPYFRTLEKQTISELSQKNRIVLSLGGGAIMDPDTRHIISQGFWIFIDTPFDMIQERVMRKSHRPLAKDIEKLKNLYASRLDTYRLAPIIIQNTGDAENICQNILQRMIAHENT